MLYDGCQVFFRQKEVLTFKALLRILNAYLR